MNLEILQTLVREGESDTVEFKKSTSLLGAGCETLCGFLNAHGGAVMFGVDAKGNLVGQDVSDATLREIANALKKFEPAVHVAIERAKLADRKEILVLRTTPVPEEQPYMFDGKAYHRVGSTTSVLPRARLQQLLLDQAHKSQRWENQPAIDIGVDDLDENEVLRTARLGIECGRLPESTGSNVADILDRLRVRKHGRLLNAAVVLFGSKLPAEYIQCQLRMARFRGVDKSEFMDQKQLNGHAFNLFEEGMVFLRRHLPVAGRILPGIFERQDEPLFPLEALREALVNALTHRDYSIAGGAVSLAIYDDRLEIWSSGSLPFSQNVEELRVDHESKPRNPIVADTFYLRGLVERWGRGTQKIIALCVKAGHPEPLFIERGGSVGIRFTPSGYIAPHRVAHDLTTRQRQILQILASATETSLRDIIAGLGSDAPAERTVQVDLEHLRRLQLVGQKGRGAGSTWFLAK